MKTDDLIAHLSDNLAPARRGLVMGALLAGLGGGVALAVMAMMMTLKPRPDLQAAMAGGAFWMKIGYTAALALVGLVIVQRQARAGADSKTPMLLLGVPVVALIVMAAVQLSEPQADSAALLMGQTWTVCPWLILLLALPVYAGLLLALRRLAPTRLALAGAAAGLVAGASAATVYGFHCPETAAPFILVWYSLGIVLAAGLGAIAGARLLRW
jgi:hypothetical protein